MDAETLLAMKEAAEKAKQVAPGPWFDWDEMEWLIEPKVLLSYTESAALIARCDPQTVSALIAERDELAAEVERQAGEIAGLELKLDQSDRSDFDWHRARP